MLLIAETITILRAQLANVIWRMSLYLEMRLDHITVHKVGLGTIYRKIFNCIRDTTERTLNNQAKYWRGPICLRG